MIQPGVGVGETQDGGAGTESPKARTRSSRDDKTRRFDLPFYFHCSLTALTVL